MPPKAMVSSGLIRRISFAAAMIMLANIFQSGSTLKSQCERLFGSFHSIMASTIASLVLDLYGLERLIAFPQARGPGYSGRPLQLQQDGKPMSPVRDELRSADQNFAASPR